MNKSVKTLLLWVVLIVVFFAVYQVTSSGKASHREPLPACETSASTVLLTWSVPALLVVGLVLWFRHWSRKYQPMNEGVRLLQDGRALEALEQFNQSRAKNPDEPSLPYNIAIAQLKLWRLEASLAELETAKKTKGPGQGSVAAFWPAHEALLCALLGRVSQAEAALALAQAKETTNQVELTKGLLAVRAADWPGARRFLNSHEVKQLGGNLGTLARTLDAWCIERMTGELRHVDRVGLFGEASPDELKRHWPELIAFVERAPAW